MLGIEPEIVRDYVNDGRVRLVFWPVLNHGDPSVYSTLTAHCIGLQDADLFWEAHEDLFERQRELWSATRDDFVNTAVQLGADQAQFEQCYDDGAALAQVLELDAIRKERGIFGQPIFDIDGQLLGGAPPYELFAQALDDVLATK